MNLLIPDYIEMNRHVIFSAQPHSTTGLSRKPQPLLITRLALSEYSLLGLLLTEATSLLSFRNHLSYVHHLKLQLKKKQDMSSSR